MMAPNANTQLKAVLGLPNDSEDDEITSALVARLTAAINDKDPGLNLLDLRGILLTEGGSQYLDPLNMLPILLPYNDPGAVEIISMIGESGSAKEVIVTAQEAVEKLKQSFEVDLEEPEIDEGGDQILKRHSRNEQMMILIDLYTKAIPRLKLRRKSAAETVRPLLQELTDVVKLAGAGMDSLEARRIISSCARLSQGVVDWVRSVTDNHQQQTSTAKSIIKDLLDSATLSCVPSVQCSVAQRAFEQYLPKFVVRSAVGDGWKEGDRAISDLLAAYHTVDIDLHACTQPITVPHLIASAYQPSSDPSPSHRLPFLLPLLLSSLQTNSFLDESLAVLIRLLHGWTTSQPLPPDITVPLANTLPTIASIHPNPLVRHQTYRALSLLLGSSEPRLRFQHLAELTGHSEYPQMRVAAVGLIKEHFLRAFNAAGPTKKDDLFLTNMFLRTFGPILFRPDPNNLFGDDSEITSLEESSEPARLSECLSLYFVVFRRDEKNLTGIRDKDMITAVETNLLAPMRKTLSRWMQDPVMGKGHQLDISPLTLLWLALERVDNAKEERCREARGSNAEITPY